jgi:hypothetical protein
MQLQVSMDVVVKILAVFANNVSTKKPVNCSQTCVRFHCTPITIFEKILTESGIIRSKLYPCLLIRQGILLSSDLLHEDKVSDVNTTISFLNNIQENRNNSILEL